MITPDDEKLIDNLLKGDHMNDTAPFQWTGQFTRTINGISLSENFTLRMDTRENMESERKNVIEKILPSAKEYPEDTGTMAHTATEEALGPCPKCSAPLVWAKKKDGTPYKKCSTNKWDRVRKIATGCDFVDWLT